MNDRDSIRTLAWGISIAVLIVLIAIIIMNAGEMTEIVKQEGIFY